MNEPKHQLFHIVTFWLKQSGVQEDKSKLIDGLKSLSAIPLIKSCHIGEPASTMERDVVDGSFDVSLVLEFTHVQDQDAYQIHPIHLEFVKRCEHLWNKVQVIDSSCIA